MARGLNACLKDSGSYPGGGFNPGRVNGAWQVSEEGPDETQHLVLQVGGWAKKIHAVKTNLLQKLLQQ